MRSREKLIAKILAFTRGNLNRSALICGSSGIGKSWILETVGQQLRGQPHRLVRNGKHNSQWPLAGLLSFLASIPMRVPAEVLELLPRNQDDQVDCFRVAMSLHHGLAEGIEPETVFLIDDLDYMDPASQQVLSFLARMLQGNRISFIATVTGQRIPESFMDVPQLRLARMERQVLRAIADEHAQHPLDDAVREILVEYCRGVPEHLIQHLLSLSAAQSRGTEPLTIPFRPVTGTEASLRCLEQDFPSGSLQILRFLAMTPVAHESALEQCVGTASDALPHLESIGLVARSGPALSLANSLMRSHLYWGTPREQRLAYQQQLAAHTILPVTSEFLRAKQDPAGIDAAGLLAKASQLLEAGQYHATVEVVEWTLRHADGAELLAPLMKLAERLTGTIHLCAACRYVRLALAQARDPRDILKLTALQLEIRTLQGQHIPLSEVYSLIEQHQQQEPELCSNLLSISALALCLNGRLAQAREDLQRAAGLWGRGDAQRLSPRHVQAQMIIDSLLQQPESTLEQYRVLNQAPVQQNHGITYVSVSTALTELGHHEKARLTLNRLQNTCAPESLNGRLAQLYAAEQAINSHDVPRGLRAVEQWNSTHAPTLIHPLPKIINAWYWLMKDRSDKVRGILDGLRPFVLDEMHSIYSNRIAGLEGEYALTRGRYEEAITFLQRAQAGQEGVPTTRLVETCVNLIEAMTLAERPEQAANEFRSMQSLMATVKSRQAKLMMRRAQALALPGEAALSRFDSLIDMWKPSDGTLELARIHHCLGSRLLLMGRPTGAAEHFVTARTLYRNIGALSWLRLLEIQSEPRHHTATAASEDLDLLNHGESQLVSMVHRGLSNKDIADELYISVSSVEARLTRLFRKTGTKNRQQLAARFAPGAVS